MTKILANPDDDFAKLRQAACAVAALYGKSVQPEDVQLRVEGDNVTVVLASLGIDPMSVDRSRVAAQISNMYNAM